MNQLQMTFTPGQWDRVSMTAVYDVDGYTYTKSYTQDDIPADQVPALEGVIRSLVNMDAPWQARQVVAMLTTLADQGADSDMPSTCTEAVELTVEVVNEAGGRRIFTHADIPALLLPDPAAVAFFKFYTGGSLPVIPH